MTLWLRRLATAAGVAPFVLLGLIGGLFYTFAVPPWQHPDEPTHFEHARLIAETGQLPPENFVSLPLRREIAESMLRHDCWHGIKQPALTDQTLSSSGGSPIGIYTFAQPRLYYIAAAVWLLPWLHLDVEGQLYVVRLFAVVLNAIVIASAWASARLLFPAERAMQLSVPAFVALNPGLTDIMSAANNDALVNVFGALFFLVLVVVFVRGFTWSRAACLLVLLAGAVMSKSTSVMLGVFLVLSLALYIGRLRWRSVAVLGALAIVFVLAAYLVSSLAPSVAATPAAHTVARYFRVEILPTLNTIFTLRKLDLLILSAVVVFKSFWAIFGWRHIYVWDGLYWVFAALTLAAIIGLGARAVKAAWRPRERRQPAGLDTPHTRLLAAALSAILLAGVIAAFRSQVEQGIVTYHSHGRYLYVLMAPFACLFMWGLFQWVPRRWHPGAFGCLVACMLAFDAACLFGFIVPYYWR